ncbi:hypothetical protein K435DRAFT_879210 [Dendrothele bispora CBS 962.96]|uniref:Uncharacterized protein n=1 Tax=Dendrothele bispora (strain CBS 962.96) TaxID=1314807 RepID=A0A4S8KLI5_DENBC|nr:hypothetical protein K435DRAFT_879210 [Dendrothele bispora CBS 962.96]
MPNGSNCSTQLGLKLSMTGSVSSGRILIFRLPIIAHIHKSQAHIDSPLPQLNLLSRFLSFVGYHVQQFPSLRVVLEIHQKAKKKSHRAKDDFIQALSLNPEFAAGQECMEKFKQVQKVCLCQWSRAVRKKFDMKADSKGRERFWRPLHSTVYSFAIGSLCPNTSEHRPIVFVGWISRSQSSL